MSDINVKLKHNLEDANTLFKILFAAIKIGEPASKRKIADVADISSQLVDYHIDKLVANGQLIIVDSKYMAQKAFLDRSIYKFLKEKVITQALVDNIAYKLDFSQAEVQDNAVLEESIITLLKLFTIELKEK
ncbi:MAG TPA: ArsR family transcriptional regulator [Marine Group III euryarchaeote]|uniref:ArsR family transcriptional regulator n=1 Tax=Marine Group III euryarchaeote TaxID=2173149 RepID=A0A7J4CZI3_9ARCH|nr:ArsR family transcriptional regulator [Marine Group III euryarchaeote]